jgi:DNA-binding NarL/FixJ family response regulator
MELTTSSDNGPPRLASPENISDQFDGEPQRRVLLIEDDPFQAERAISALAELPEPFHVDWVTSLRDAEMVLDLRGAEIILLDLTLAGDTWQGAIKRLKAASPHALLVALSDTPDPMAMQAIMQQGMHDVLCKQHVDGYWISRTLESAIRRKAAMMSWRAEQGRGIEAS